MRVALARTDPAGTFAFFEVEDSTGHQARRSRAVLGGTVTITVRRGETGKIVAERRVRFTFESRAGEHVPVVVLVPRFARRHSRARRRHRPRMFGHRGRPGRFHTGNRTDREHHVARSVLEMEGDTGPPERAPPPHIDRPIVRARFVAEYYGMANVAFGVSDVDEFGTDRQWDVVLNLGVLYHVTNPLQFVRRTYDLCRRFAIFDTTCSPEPFAGFALIGDKDVDDPNMGRESWELHPTYRGAIDAIKYAGFREVVEIRGTADPPHLFYEIGERRCFLAIK